MKKKPSARLENWTFEKMGDYLRLWGNVYGNPNFPDGLYIHTSAIVNLNETYMVAETRNTFYTLGKKAKDASIAGN